MEDPDPAPEQSPFIQIHDNNDNNNDPAPKQLNVGRPKCWNYKSCKNIATLPQHDLQRQVNAPQKTVCDTCYAYYKCLGPESLSHQYGNCYCSLVGLYDPFPLPESEMNPNRCLYRNDPSCKINLIDPFEKQFGICYACQHKWGCCGIRTRTHLEGLCKHFH